MGGQELTEQLPPEQIRLVKELIRKAGISQYILSGGSGDAAKAYRVRCPYIPDSLSASTVSRMRTGSGLKKLKRCNLVLLHLTIHHIKLSGQEGRAAALVAANAAEDFADTVLQAGSTFRTRRAGFYEPNHPRHNRVADLFGEYGIGLLESAIAQSDAGLFRELAVLQLLSGNTDDARYWNSQAADAASCPLEILSPETAAREAFVAGRSYIYKERRATAEVYLSLAADGGHADAALLLGDVLQALQRTEEARRWFSVAQHNGHCEAGERLAALAAEP